MKSKVISSICVFGGSLLFLGFLLLIVTELNDPSGFLPYLCKFLIGLAGMWASINIVKVGVSNNESIQRQLDELD